MIISDYSKKSFIRFALTQGVLKFGSFTLKSGRVSPYFFNIGLFYKGTTLRTLGHFYAQTLLEQSIDCIHLFGPAYKGIPLAVATSIALAERDIVTEITFNRKEEKDHGEGGFLIGAPVSDNMIMIDDVITAGTAFREAWQQIKDNGGNLNSVIIALDRCERGISEQSTIEEIRSQNIRVFSLITLYDLIDYLEEEQAHSELNLLRAYQLQYCTT